MNHEFHVGDLQVSFSRHLYDYNWETTFLPSLSDDCAYLIKLKAIVHNQIFF